MEHDFSFTRRDVLVGLAIVLLAFCFRFIVIVDRATALNNAGAFDPLPAGSDQLTYYSHIAAYEADKFPPSRYFYQPGMSWFLIAVSQIVRTDHVGVLRLVIALLAAVNCGLFVIVARLAFGRRDVGILSGILLAIYPVGVFYDTDFVITSQTTELLTLALLGILLLWRRQCNWVGVVLYGASFGLLAITRFEPIFLAPLFGLWLIYVRRDRLAVVQVTIGAVICIGVILPVVLHNRADGADYLITPVGTAEIYRGNNRDADGTYGGGQASKVTSTDYMEYLWKDILLSPRRFGELVLHKIGIYLSADEPGNNLNYFEAGESVSPLLRAVPLDFRILLMLFFFGLLVLVRQRKLVAWLFGASFLVLMGAILLIWVEARLRTPAIVLMIPVAAFGLLYLVDFLRQARRAVSYADLAHVGTSVAIIAAILVSAHLCNRYLPRPLTTNKLPKSAHVINAVYDGTLKLVGWEVQEEYSPSGIIAPFRPYVVTLYWELLAPTSVDYTLSFGHYVDSERTIAFDYPIGKISYPYQPTSMWQTGAIYIEHVGLAYKQFDGPVAVSGPLLLSVYRERDASNLLHAEGDVPYTSHIQLTQPAIIWGTGSLPENLSAPYVDIQFGDVLTLKNWEYAATAYPGESLEILTGWQTTKKQISRNLVFSTGLLDAAGILVTNTDSPPHEGRLLSTSLPPNYLFTDTKVLPLPDEPGVYTVYVLVYDSETGERLAIPGNPNNLLTLGAVEVLSADEVQ